MKVPVRSDTEIETAITSLGAEAVLVVMTDSYMAIHRGIIISLAANHRVPAIFESTTFAKEGGLISYGPSQLDMFRRSVSYIDRILHGAKPDDLPVQVPTQFDLMINLKTAKALGLTVPLALLTRADEVIE